MDQVTVISADALWSAADMLRDHSKEAPTGAMEQDVLSLAEAMAKIAAQGGPGSRRVTIRISAE